MEETAAQFPPNHLLAPTGLRLQTTSLPQPAYASKPLPCPKRLTHYITRYQGYVRKSLHGVI
ncbi:MAG: hypothetical protein HYW48_09880 [Deltaproteobacteria bacterium]|nr:hypothetical protein [Deltaproteobacteria bacterium]